MGDAKADSVDCRRRERDRVGGRRVELAVEVVGLEVDSDLFLIRDVVDQVHREGTLTIRTFEAQIPVVLDDEGEAGRAVERLRTLDVGRPDGHLVQALRAFQDSGDEGAGASRPGPVRYRE